MGAPLLLADNLLAATQYGSNVLVDQSGTTGPVGNEVWRVGDGRRSAFDFWQPGVTNADAFLLLTCMGLPAGSTTPTVMPRGANCLIVDRGHNLGGFAVKLLGSNDNVSFATVVSAFVPTVGGVIGGANGVLTEEGAWLVTFPSQGYAYWKFDVPAMGVGLQPAIVGLWLGMAYQPVALYRPFMEHPTDFRAQETVSPLGWRGRGPRAFNRSGALNVRMNDFFEYVQLARFTLDELFGAGVPMWVVQDQDRATEAFLALRPIGTQGFVQPQNWATPIGTLNVLEHEPLPVS